MVGGTTTEEITTGTESMAVNPGGVAYSAFGDGDAGEMVTAK